MMNSTNHLIEPAEIEVSPQTEVPARLRYHCLILQALDGFIALNRTKLPENFLPVSSRVRTEVLFDTKTNSSGQPETAAYALDTAGYFKSQFCKLSCVNLENCRPEVMAVGVRGQGENVDFHSAILAHMEI